jgi:hypothetical protein
MDKHKLRVVGLVLMIAALFYGCQQSSSPGPNRSDAALSSLAASGTTLKPAFASATTTYAASIANTVTSTTVTASANSALATIAATKDGAAYTLGTQASLNVGDNVFSVVVTAGDKTTTKTYTLTVTRGQSSATNDADLGALAASGATLTPAFSSATTAYTASLANSVTSTTVSATTDASGASIAATFTAAGAAATAYDLGASATLNVGDNVFSLVVTSGDGSVTETYTLTLTRNEPPGLTVILSNSGDLSFTGADGTTLAPGQSWTIVPSFSGATMTLWYLDGVQVSSASSYVLSASQLAAGDHTLGLLATVNGLNYYGTFAFTVAAPGNLAVGISLANQDLVFSPATDSLIQGQSYTFTANIAGATSYAWYMDAAPISSASSSSYTVSGSSLGIGPHVLTAAATVGSATYSGSFDFNVLAMGSGDLNIFIAQGSASDLSFSGFGPQSGTPNLSAGQVWNLVPSFGSASSYAWYLDGNPNPVASTSTLSLEAGQGALIDQPGPHSLTLFVTLNHLIYSSSLNFTVSN